MFLMTGGSWWWSPIMIQRLRRLWPSLGFCNHLNKMGYDVKRIDGYIMYIQSYSLISYLFISSPAYLVTFSSPTPIYIYYFEIGYLVTRLSRYFDIGPSTDEISG